MTERKVLNKYFPPDYDPSKIPRLPKEKGGNRTFNIRTMSPCNMRCNSCMNYIYKGRKFNSRMEVAEGETFLGLRIYRFYIKCPACVSEITWKTDLEKQDYALEHGATRNFEALRTAQRQAAKDQEEYEAELEANPMKMLEARTAQSKNEMDRLEALGDLKELNKRQAGFDANETALKRIADLQKQQREADEFEDEEFVKKVFGKKTEEEDCDDDIEDDTVPESARSNFKIPVEEKETEEVVPLEKLTPIEPASLLVSEAVKRKAVSVKPSNNSLKSKLAGLVVPKKPRMETSAAPSTSAASSSSSSNGLLGLGLNYSDSDNSDSDNN